MFDLEIFIFTCLQLRQGESSMQQPWSGRAGTVVPGQGRLLIPTSFVKFCYQVIKRAFPVALQ